MVPSEMATLALGRRTVGVLDVGGVLGRPAQAAVKPCDIMDRMAADLSRFIVAVRQQFTGVEPRLRIVLAVSNRLPTDAFGALRLRLLRLAGLRIGAGSGTGGDLRLAGGASPGVTLRSGPSASSTRLSDGLDRPDHDW